MSIFSPVQIFLFKHVPIGPLIVFRIAFGFVMLFSTLRFLLLGWVQEQYLRPVYHFNYEGFEWVKVLSPAEMYVLFLLMSFSALAIMLGAFYRLASVLFFICFTYVELLDKTYYLNHYYFVSLVAFLMCFLPAEKYFSVDVLRKPKIAMKEVPAFTIHILKFQIACVYFFAGISKINSNWLLEAMPLRLWLPAQDGFPFVGFLFREVWVAYAFAWIGMIYDISIPFLLLNKKTRLPAYLILLSFHALTGYFFQIGVFPLVMSLCTLIFFSDQFHFNLIGLFQKITGQKNSKTHQLNPSSNYQTSLTTHNPQLKTLLIFTYITVQILLPFRYLMYPGNLFWTEEGYRFSWRVMLVEKAGTATFTIHNNKTNQRFDVINSQFLNAHQEKQMAIQPDMMFQFAHFLGEHFKSEGMKDISVYCDCYVTMNGQPSRLILNPKVDLLSGEQSIIPY